MKFLCGDIECDGLLDQLTKLHCAVFYNPELDHTYVFTDLVELEVFLKDHEDYYLVIHNGVTFDKPALKKLGVNVPNRIVDTLALSWYLYLNNPKHGLEWWGEQLGVAKPEITDWENLSEEEYIHRCTEDVKIQTLLWNKFNEYLKQLYPDPKMYTKFIHYMEWKMDQQRIQANNKLKLDIDSALKLKEYFEEEKQKRLTELESVMPKVPVYTTYKKPKVMFKKNGEPSTLGLKWSERLSQYAKDNAIELGKLIELEEIKVIKEYTAPNGNSDIQVKAWLTALGWKPETFKYVKKDLTPEELAAAREAVSPRERYKVKPYTKRAIPQIKGDNGLCPSVSRLVAKHPQIKMLEDLGIVAHRLSIVDGFLRDNVNGYLTAECSGWTNTIRLKHKKLVNLPSIRTPYGKEVRGLLQADKGRILLGSDLSSLEDRLKHHFQWDIDPDYVKTQMEDGFDSHLLNALKGGLITEEDFTFYKEFNSEEDEADKARYETIAKFRHIGKGVTYCCQYGGGVEALMEQIGLDEDTAKRLHKAYNDLNWTIKEIAESTKVVKINEQKWQLNPINGFYYHLKNNKDRFSTLIQGTGSYILDLWLFIINNHTKKVYNKEIPLCAQFHDELVLALKDNETSKEALKSVVNSAIDKMNRQLGLNRDMACDIQFGKCYADIH